MLYLFRRGNRVAHFGWLNIGFCNFYKVAEGEVTIGPIWSDQGDAREGIGDRRLETGGQCDVRSRARVFYIDTSEDNIPAQRAIAKAGFGSPVDFYAETADGWVHLDGDDGGTDSLKGEASL